MRVISSTEIDRLLTFPALIDALADAFRGDFVTPVRHHHEIERPGGHGTLLLMPSWTGSAVAEGFMGVKVVSVFPENGTKNLPSVLGTYLLMDDDGQITEGHSISAGLDYPGIGPEHAWLNDIKRVNYVSATDKEALEAFQLCCKLEGIIPALEPAHALAHVMKIAPSKPKDHLMVMNLCGRGDKDIFTVADILGAGNAP